MQSPRALRDPSPNEAMAVPAQMPSTAQSTRTVGVSMPLSQSIASVTCGTHCLTIRGNQMQSEAIRGNQSIASVTCGTHGLALGRTTVALSVALGRTVMWDSGTQNSIAALGGTQPQSPRA